MVLVVWLILSVLVSVTIAIGIMAANGIQMTGMSIFQTYMGAAGFPVIIYLLVHSFFIKKVPLLVFLLLC